MKFDSYSEEGYYWFCVNGIGLYFADRVQHCAPFSERMGIRKVLRIGPLAIGFLK